MKRILKWLAVGAVVLLVVLTATIVYMVRRPWPQVDGELAVQGLTAPVEVVRDDWGVPHLYAENEPDLFFAQGYVHAQDRLWQMHMSRTVARGRLAALFGPAGVETDRLVHVLGLPWAAENDWELLGEDLRRVLEAYSAGVNAYADAHRGNLGLEFRILGVDPEPWTPIDTLSFTKLLTLTIALNSSREMARVNLRRRLGEELGAEADERILARYGDDAPVIVDAWPTAGAASVSFGDRSPHPQPLSQGERGARAFLKPLSPWGEGRPGADWGEGPGSPGGRSGRERSREAWLDNLPSGLGDALGRGSNAWVVAGSRTKSGKPLLANDPHLGLGMPSVWYENGLHGGGFDVVGFSFPGLPTVVTGHNGRIAWGITSLVSDTQDLFLEELDDEEDPKRYRYQDEWRDLEVRRETIEVKGGEPVEVVVRSTHHGPIVNEVFEAIRDEPPMALSWVTHYGDRILQALVDLDRAAGWESFRGALSFWDAPALSFVYADVDGNIGYQATGRHPIRAAGHDGSMPVPGWTGEYDWRDFIPREELPWLFNPPSGMIVSANNKTVSDDYPYVLSVDWADPSRARRITELLAEGGPFTREDMARMQADTYSVLAEEVRPYLLGAEPADDLERRALEELRQWDLRFEPDRVGASVFFVWQWRLYRDIVADELGDPEKLLQDTAVVYQQHSTLDEILARADDPWFDDRTTPEVETREDMVRRALTDAVAWLRENHGEDPAGWSWGKLHPMVFTHQPLGQTGVSFVDRLFNSDELGGHGTSFTIFATTPSVARPFAAVSGTSERFIADLADLEQSLVVNSTGQCAHLFHRHREDQIPLWDEVRYRPVHLRRDLVEGAAEGTLTLTPQQPR